MSEALKNHIRGRAHFRYYRDKTLFYITDDGFEFMVPIDDIDQGTFLAEDSAVYFMRWIRKMMELQKSWKHDDPKA